MSKSLKKIYNIFQLILECNDPLDSLPSDITYLILSTNFTLFLPLVVIGDTEISCSF